MSCRRIDDLRNVLPGWGCCQCSGYNGYQRPACRHCGHPHCYEYQEGELLPVVSPDGKIRDHYDPERRVLVPVEASA